MFYLQLYRLDYQDTWIFGHHMVKIQLYLATLFICVHKGMQAHCHIISYFSLAKMYKIFLNLSHYAKKSLKTLKSEERLTENLILCKSPILLRFSIKKKNQVKRVFHDCSKFKEFFAQ